MRMPRTSSFSVRDILDLGPKPSKEEEAVVETKLPGPRPDLLGPAPRPAPGPVSPPSLSLHSPSISSTTGPAARLPLSHWSGLQPFLAQHKRESRLSSLPAYFIFACSGLHKERS